MGPGFGVESLDRGITVKNLSCEAIATCGSPYSSRCRRFLGGIIRGLLIAGLAGLPLGMVVMAGCIHFSLGKADTDRSYPDIRIVSRTITGDTILVELKKEIDGELKKTRQFVRKGTLVGEGVFQTDYILYDIKEFCTIKRINDKHKIKQKGWEIIFRHKDTGKLFTKWIKQGQK